MNNAANRVRHVPIDDAYAVRYQAVTQGYAQMSIWSAGKDWMSVDMATGFPQGVFSQIFNGQ